MPVPNTIIQYRLVILDPITENPTDGGKMGQVNDAFSAISGIATPEILAIGYSAGADSALMFADEFIQTSASGEIVAVVVLGGTLTGYSEYRNSQIYNFNYTPDRTDIHLYDDIVNLVAASGIPIYAFDDKYGQQAALWSQVDNLNGLSYVSSPVDHIEQVDIVRDCNDPNLQGPPPTAGGSTSATNVNTTVRNDVIQWLINLGINPADF